MCMIDLQVVGSPMLCLSSLVKARRRHKLSPLRRNLEYMHRHLTTDRDKIRDETFESYKKTNHN